MKKLARIATTVASRSCATIRYWRGVRLGIFSIGRTGSWRLNSGV
jgi:hypothetical protein